MSNDLATGNTRSPVCRGEAAGSAGEEREILVTIYIYEHDSDAVNVDLGHVMRDLNCSFYSPCELTQRFFTIGTDAYASNDECVERFIAALKASGVNIGKHEWSTLPNESVLATVPGLNSKNT